jgi:hypothetical protein
MGPKVSKMSKKAAAGITRHIIFTIPKTLEIIRQPGIITWRRVIMAVYKIGLLTIHGTKKYKDKITCKN